MKRKYNQCIVTASLLLIVMMLMCGCLAFRDEVVKPPAGILFMNVKAPITTNFDKTPNTPDLIKTSYSQTTYIHDIILTWLGFGWGNVDIPQIAKRGGIEKVCYADYELTTFLYFVFRSFTVNVYGLPPEGNAPSNKGN